MPPLRPSPRYLAVLETMWDWNGLTSGAGYLGTAPRFFHINPRNFSGARLLRLVGGPALGLAKILDVTNSCPKLANGPNSHGVPDPAWLGENLRRWQALLALPHNQGKAGTVLVCGAVAQRTFAACGGWPGRTVLLPHPAARHWTTAALERAGEVIRGGTASVVLTVVRGELVEAPYAP